MQDRKSDIKAKFVRHFLNDVQLDSGGIGFVVDGQQGYASFVLGNDGIGCNNTGTAGLATPFGGYRHSDFTNTWTKFCTLEGVLLKTITEVSDVIRQTTISFIKVFETMFKLGMTLNLVTHLKTGHLHNHV